MERRFHGSDVINNTDANVIRQLVTHIPRLYPLGVKSGALRNLFVIIFAASHL